jgi:hypothetical protein
MMDKYLKGDGIDLPQKEISTIITFGLGKD